MRDIISSAQNPNVKLAIKLRKAGARKKEDLVIIEGYPEINAAAQAGLPIEVLFYCAKLSAPGCRPESVMSRETLPVSAAMFRKIAYREHPDGFLALARPRYPALADIRLGAVPLLVAMESVEKPGNLGAVLRSADAAGADAVVVCDPQTDIYNPNVIRASRGAVFTVPVVTCPSAEAIAYLGERGIGISAATLEARQIYTAADLTGPLAIAIGAEHAGLSQAWLKAAAAQLKIPMRGRVDSLNASVSAAIILFEALRQRQSLIKN